MVVAFGALKTKSPKKTDRKSKTLSNNLERVFFLGVKISTRLLYLYRYKEPDKS